MLQTVDIGERKLARYEGTAPKETLEQLRAVGARLRGLRILHVNATPYGGGVAELLRSTVPLLNDIGLVADWKIIGGDKDFFEVTKAIHNGLQGANRLLEDEERAAYRAASETNAALLEELYDIVFVHDPQPVAIPFLRGKGNARWIWRCHIDTSAPNPDTWEFIRPYLEVYDAAIFTLERFVLPQLPTPRIEVIPPAIDPLSPKNCEIGEDMARDILEWIGIEFDRPLVTQISRFDPWKDPLGVIAAYRQARDEVPDLQLALAGSMALDDPEGWDVYREITEETGDDPLIHVFTNLTGVGNVEVNAFQRVSDVVVQKSIREGFGLVVSEAMWKGTPVIAARAGGIPLQMADGAGGILVDSIESCGEAIVKLLRDHETARALGTSGRERVRRHFLLPRLLLNELLLVEELMAGVEAPIAVAVAGVDTDPVCGMVVEVDTGAPRERWGGREYVFCSKACLLGFQRRPRHYVGSDGVVTRSKDHRQAAPSERPQNP
jgi:trehalose synthase